VKGQAGLRAIQSNVLFGNYHFKKQWGAQDQPLYYQCWLAEGSGIPDLNPHSA